MAIANLQISTIASQGGARGGLEGAIAPSEHASLPLEG